MAGWRKESRLAEKVNATSHPNRVPVVKETATHPAHRRGPYVHDARRTPHHAVVHPSAHRQHRGKPRRAHTQVGQAWTRSSGCACHENVQRTGGHRLSRTGRRRRRRSDNNRGRQQGHVSPHVSPALGWWPQPAPPRSPPSPAGGPSGPRHASARDLFRERTGASGRGCANRCTPRPPAPLPWPPLGCTPAPPTPPPLRRQLPRWPSHRQAAWRAGRGTLSARDATSPLQTDRGVPRPPRPRLAHGRTHNAEVRVQWPPLLPPPCQSSGEAGLQWLPLSLARCGCAPAGRPVGAAYAAGPPHPEHARRPRLAGGCPTPRLTRVRRRRRSSATVAGRGPTSVERRWCCSRTPLRKTTLAAPARWQGSVVAPPARPLTVLHSPSGEPPTSATGDGRRRSPAAAATAGAANAAVVRRRRRARVRARLPRAHTPTPSVAQIICPPPAGACPFSGRWVGMTTRRGGCAVLARAGLSRVSGHKTGGLRGAAQPTRRVKAGPSGGWHVGWRWVGAQEPTPPSAGAERALQQVVTATPDPGGSQRIPAAWAVEMPPSPAPRTPRCSVALWECLAGLSDFHSSRPLHGQPIQATPPCAARIAQEVPPQRRDSRNAREGHRVPESRPRPNTSECESWNGHPAAVPRPLWFCSLPRTATRARIGVKCKWNRNSCGASLDAYSQKRNKERRN